jgi:hypothetical protein
VVIHSGWRISLISLAARSFVSTFLMLAFLSDANRCSLYLTSLELGFNSNLCLANSLRTLSMYVSFHTKISLLSLRKLVGMSSYAWLSSALMVAILEGSPIKSRSSLVGSPWELSELLTSCEVSLGHFAVTTWRARLLLASSLRVGP